MMKKSFAFMLVLLTVSVASAFAQVVTDSITMKKVSGSLQFYQGDQKLNMDQLVNTMKSNEQAYKQIQSAQSTNTLATIIGSAGGFMIGWPIGTALGGGEPNWVMAGIGAGLVLVSIPVTQSFKKKVIQAVDTYNSGSQVSSFWDNSELKLSMTGNGVGLTLVF